ncbi:unnamed protein product [Lota lota]
MGRCKDLSDFDQGEFVMAGRLVSEHLPDGRSCGVSRLLHVGLRSRRPVHSPKRLQRARERQNWTVEQWEKVACSDESRSRCGWLGKRCHQDALWEVGRSSEAV